MPDHLESDDQSEYGDSEEYPEFEIYMDSDGFISRGSDTEPLPDRRSVLEYRHGLSQLDRRGTLQLLRGYLEKEMVYNKVFEYEGEPVTLNPILQIIDGDLETDFDTKLAFSIDEWLDEQISIDELTDEELCYFSEYDIGLELYEKLGAEKAEEIGLKKDFGGLYPGHRFAAVRFIGGADLLQTELRGLGIHADVFAKDS